MFNKPKHLVLFIVIFAFSFALMRLKGASSSPGNPIAIGDSTHKLKHGASVS